MPAPPPAAAPHARFIPREELNSFAAWTPGNLAGGPAPQTAVQRPQPAQEAPRPDTAEVIAAQLRSARQAGYQDGYRDGLAALEAFKQSFANQLTAQIGTLVKTLDQELEGLQQDMARTLAISATQLARQIVRSELIARADLVAQVAQEALDTLLLSARHITLRVHPDDHALVALGAADVIAARGGRLVSDASMARGGCLVESDIGVIDATIETRWRRAAASLGCDEAWAPAEAPEDDR
jgi:flagellar assembly protein FliH